MDIPGIGPVDRDDPTDPWISEGVPVPLLNAQHVTFIIDGYDEGFSSEYDEAIAAFLAAPPALLQDAIPALFAYYLDHKKLCEQADEPLDVVVSSPDRVLEHIYFGDTEVVVARRNEPDRSVYVSVSGGCDWETEHGLQVVFKGGSTVCKVGPYDGHFTNADAYGDPTLEGVVFHPTA
ncbi:MAG: hypothetical protein AAF581_22635 [Planctomycetota bacterium]